MSRLRLPCCCMTLIVRACSGTRLRCFRMARRSFGACRGTLPIPSGRVSFRGCTGSCLGALAMDLPSCRGDCAGEEVLLVPFVSRSVVLLARDRVQENVTGGVHLRRRHRVATAVGVQLANQCAMGLLDVVVACHRADTKRDIVVCHGIVFDGHAS